MEVFTAVHEDLTLKAGPKFVSQRTFVMLSAGALANALRYTYAGLASHSTVPKNSFRPGQTCGAGYRKVA